MPADIPVPDQSFRNTKFTGSNLYDRIKVPDDVSWVLSDPDCRIVDEAIGRHGKIIRSRYAIENAAGQIVFRAMTRTEVTA